MSNNSWKQYGGISKMDNFNTINASTIIADQFISRSVRPQYQLLNGTFEVTDHVIAGNSIHADVDMFSNRDIYANNKLFFGNNTFARDKLVLPTLTDVQKITHAYLYGNDTNIGINTILPKTIFNITGTIGSITDILTVESKNVLIRNIIAQNKNQHGIVVDADDASSNIMFYNDVSTNSINVPDAMIKYQSGGILTTQTTDLILSTAKVIQHDSSGGTLLMNSTGTTLTSSGYLDVDISGQIIFNTDTGFQVDSANDFIVNCSGTILSFNDISSNINTTGNILFTSTGPDGLGGNIVLDSSGGVIEFNSGDIKLNTLLKFSPPERGVSNELLHNETVTIYDNANTQFLHNVYNDPTILTGSSITCIGKDPSANTFLFMNPATRKDGAAIGGGMAPYDSSRAMTVIGMTDSSGNYIPSQMTVSSTNKHKYISTVGINTHKPRTEDYVLDVNGSMHLGNGEINTIADNTYEVIYMNFSKTHPDYGVALGSPSTSTGSGVNKTPDALLTSGAILSGTITDRAYTGLQTTSLRPSGGSSGSGAVITIVALENEITSITVTDSGNGYAVGDTITVTAETLTSAGIGSNTDLVFTLFAGDIVDVAEYNQILLYTNDGGEKWNKSDIFASTSLNTDTVINMRYIDVFDDSYSAIAGEGGNLFLSKNSGQTWYKLQLKDVGGTPDYKTINIIAFSDTNGLTNGDNTHRIFISYSNGSSTGIYYFDCELYGDNSLLGTEFTINIQTIGVDATNGYQSTTTISDTYDYAIHSASSTDGRIYYAGNGGTFSYDIKTNDLRLDNNATNYNNIYAFGDDHAIAVSTTGISYTTDGLSWNHKTFTQLSLSTTMVLNSVFIKSLSNAIAVGSQGEFIYSTDWQNGVWQMVPDNLLNSSGMRDRIRGPENNLKSISMPDANTIIIADTITPFISNADFTQTQLGYSKIQYCFLPNLFNRTNNTVLDVSGNIVISGDVEVFDGELLVNTIDYKSQNTADISGTMNIGTKTHVVNIGKTDERTKIEPAINRLFDTCDSVINIGVTDPLYYDSSSVLINMGNYSQNALDGNRKSNKINIGGGKDIVSLGGTIVYSSTEISSSKNKGFQINDLNLQDGIKIFMSTNGFTDDNLPTGVTIVNDEYTYTFGLPTNDVSYNLGFETYIIAVYKPNNSGGGAGIRVTDNLDRDAGYLVVSDDMDGWVMKPTNVGSNSIKIDVNSLILRDTGEWINASTVNLTDVSYGIPEKITNGIVMLTRTTESDSSYALRVQQLDIDNILIRDSDSTANEQIIKTNLSVIGDVDITGELRATVMDSRYIINTIVTDYEFIVTQDMSLGGILFVGGDASFNANMDITGKVAIGKHNPVVTLDISATDAIRLPVGTTDQRPIKLDSNVGIAGYSDENGVPIGYTKGFSSELDKYVGSIRYNTTNKQFEGFGPGETWGSLKGVVNVAQNTKITAESYPTETNNQLRFYTANYGVAQLQMIIDASSGGVAIGTGYATDVSKNELDISDNSLIVEGKVGIGTKRPNVILDISGTDAIRLPVGIGSERPITNDITDQDELNKYIGSIRYNNTVNDEHFEGFGPGNSWGSIGGVVNVARNTKITAESAPAETNNQLQFFTAPKVGSLNVADNHFLSKINNLTEPITGSLTYTVTITGGSGSGAILEFKGDATGITYIKVKSPGTGYIKGDILTVTATTETNISNVTVHDTGRTTDLVFRLTTDGDNGTSGGYDIYLDPDVNNDGTMAERMIVDYNGYVGIGTTAPLELLDVGGDALINGYTIGKGSGNKMNTAFGFQALLSNIDGNYNTAIGHNVLISNINGTSNVAIGFQSLETNVLGSNNTAIGIHALQKSTASNNTAIGYRALATTTVGNFNTAIGQQALEWNETGANNTAIGFGAGKTNVYGGTNTYLGYGADGTGTATATSTISAGGAVTGFTIINEGSGYTHSPTVVITGGGGTGATATATRSVDVNNNPLDTIQFINVTDGGSGYTSAPTVLISGGVTWDQSTAIGYDAKITKSDQLVLGKSTDPPEVYIPGNVGIGTTSPSSLLDLHKEFSESGLMPASDLTFTTTNNTVDWSLGSIEGYVKANNGSSNNYPGGLVFKTKVPSDTASNNVLTERMVIDSNGNVGIGTDSPGALLDVTGGDALINTLTVGLGNSDLSTNTAVGYNTLSGNNSGIGRNVAIGFNALTTNTSGTENTATGYQALKLTATGIRNTALGYDSGKTNKFGDNNLYLGYNANPNADDYSNSTAIGANSTITKSDQIVLGKVDSPPEVYIPGNVGIGTTTPDATLDVIGNIRTGDTNAGTHIELSSGKTGDANEYRIAYIDFSCLHGDYDGRIICQGTAAAGTTADIGSGTMQYEGSLHTFIGGDIRIIPLNAGNDTESKTSNIQLWATFDQTIDLNIDDGASRRAADITCGYAETNYGPSGQGAWGNEYLSFGVGNPILTPNEGTSGQPVTGVDLKTERMRITTLGVGIGTTTPQYKLDVNGNARIGYTEFADTGTGNGELKISAQSEHGNAKLFLGVPNESNGAHKVAIITEGLSDYSRGKLHFCLNNSASMDSNSINDDATISHARMTILPNGPVGIGTDSPTNVLHLKDTSLNELTIGQNAADGGGVHHMDYWHNSGGNPHPFYINHYSGEDIILCGSSNKGDCSIGASISAGYKLNVGGTVQATSYNAISDIRHKENVCDLENALEKINAIRGVNFSLIDDKEKRLHSGIIAQEVAEIIPEAICKSDDEKWSANYNTFIGYLIESVKTLSKENETLKTKVDSLESKLDLIMKHLNL